ncbi:MAG: hypothetical protein ABW187_06125 [Dokdonella sp.]
MPLLPIVSVATAWVPAAALAFKAPGLAATMAAPTSSVRLDVATQEATGSGVHAIDWPAETAGLSYEYCV